jgi:hypothetical protein
MWTNLSSIAQKAKEAAALIEEQINDSLLGREDSAADGSPLDGDDLGSDGNGRTPGSASGSSGGWEKCDDISSDEGGDEDGKGKQLNDTEKEKSRPQEMSFVDLKGAVAKDIPKGSDDTARGLESNVNSALMEALARLESLEKQVNSLKDELAAAREESQNYHATNLLLEQQVKELQEENTSLKESKTSEN